YALTVSPTVYVSYIELFWSTAKIKTLNNETQIRAKVDGKTIVIIESSVRRDLHFNDVDGITCLTNTEIFENLQLMGQGKDFSGTVTPLFTTMLIQSQAVEGEGSGPPTESQHTPTTASSSYVEPIPISSGPTTLVADEIVHEERRDSMERAATTATSLDAKQGSGNINMTHSTAIPNDPFRQGISSGSSPKRQDTMGDRPAQTRFERLSKQSNEPPLSRVNTLGSGEDSMKLQELMDLCIKLSDKVLDLENVKNAQALKIQKLKKREDASKQERNEIDQDEGISWFQEDLETQGRYGHDTGVNTTSTSITIASINITTAELVTTASAPVTTGGVSMKSEKSKAKGVTMQEPSESETRVRVPPPQIDPKDKGKAKMVEPEKPKKKKDQIEYDAIVAQRLQAELDEEARLEREREKEASKAANGTMFKL
ncbi:hypothetical protein Tco_1248900, partial [Tanacetum coccineum]